MRLELAGLGRLDGRAVNAAVRVRGSGGRLEFTSLELADGTAVNASVGGGGGGARFEFTSLDLTIVTEFARNLGGNRGIGLVDTLFSAGLGGGESGTSHDGVGDLGVLLLGGAGSAPDVTRVLLEGLDVEGKVATTALEAKLVVGVVTSLEGFEGVSSFAAFGAGFSRHVAVCWW